MEVGDSIENGSQITPLEQGTSTLCWATCYAMMLQFQGRTNTPEAVKNLLDPLKSDEEFYAHLKKYRDDHPDVDPPVDPDAERDIWGYSSVNGLQVEQMPWSAKGIGLMGYKATKLNDEDNFAWVIENHGPLWCSGHFIEEDGLHAVLAIGLTKRKSGTAVHILDPYGTYNSKWQSLRYQRLLPEFYKDLLKEYRAVQIWP